MTEILHGSESVTEGHPDVICNRIAGEILDAAIIASEKVGGKPRVAMEVSAKGTQEGGELWLFGEVSLPIGVTLDYETIARKTVASIGYTDPKSNFSSEHTDVRLSITEQSQDIDRGVSQKRLGAGDQGVMFGGAVASDGPEFMPLPIMIAHALTQKHTELMKKGQLTYLRPDGKAQVLVRYDGLIPVGIEHVTMAASHDPLVELGQVREDLYKHIIMPVLDEFGFGLDAKHNLVINGGGAWTIYGPLADAGTTNRKIVVDSYGGAFSHGGGGFNGKDPTKVDVTGAVGARYVAKALVREGLAKKLQIEVNYSLGIPDAVGVNFETYGTRQVSSDTLKKRANQVLDFSVSGIIDTLKLWQPIYGQAAAGGWFGRQEFPWEQHP